MSQIVYLPFVVEEAFLKDTVDTLERLREESEMRGHGMLASLLAIAKGEAEDDLKTRAKTRHLQMRAQEQDDGAARMARKLACRIAGQAAGQSA
jgi:hypothetical protein